MAIGPRTRVLLIAATLFAAVAALVWYLSYRYWSQPVTPLAPPSPDAETSAPPRPLASPAAAPTAGPSAAPTASPASSPQPNASPGASPSADASQPGASQSGASQPGANSPDGAAAGALQGLLIPVAGVRPEQLQDTFKDARSAGRVHDSIDIIAPRGTPVFAAADGRVVKLFRSARGGITLYQLAAGDERVVLYYAHLERYADGLAEGHFARRGETVGYVGDSGNATPGNTHLHFQIYRVADPRHFWTGDNINPYPLLRGAH